MKEQAQTILAGIEEFHADHQKNPRDIDDAFALLNSIEDLLQADEDSEQAQEMTLERFIELALGFDFYTDMSDDHRVYLTGRKRREVMDSFAAGHEVAGRLWKRICQQQLDNFMVAQYINRAEDVILMQASRFNPSHSAYDELRKFVPYLVTVGADTFAGRSMRDAIAKHIGAPPSYAVEQKAEREAMIDDFITSEKWGVA